MSSRHKIMRIATVPLSLTSFCKELMLELGDRYDVVAVSSPGDELDQLSQAGLYVVPVEMERQISPLRDLKSLIAMVKMMKREKPHIVHSVTPKAGLLSMIAARIAGVPVRVHSFTGLVFPTSKGLKRLVLKTTDRITCLCATHILPEGKGVMSDLSRARITSKPMRVLGNGNIRGIDPGKYTVTDEVRQRAADLRRGFGIADSDFVCLYVGRIVRDKGINELVAAFQEILHRHPDTVLLIAGVYEDSDPVSATTRSILSAHPRIHISDGWQSDLLPWYAAADALVFPSYREGFPNVVLEAGVMELPSVVTDINGSREIISDNHNGYIVPTHDAHAIALAVNKLIEHPDKAREMGRHARHNVISKFEASYIRQCYKDFYAEVLPTLPLRPTPSE